MKWWILVMVLGFKSWPTFEVHEFPLNRDTHFNSRADCEGTRDAYNKMQEYIGEEIQYACVAQIMRRNDE